MNNVVRISCICITYGRVPLLQEALQCFLDQEYADREIIIFNSLDAQTLRYSDPRVKIINSPVRPKTLGETRNLAIEHATGDLLVTWDSDDLYLPNHLSNFAKGFDLDQHDWVRHDKQFFAKAWKIDSVTHGTCNTFAFTKRAWKAVGGYNAENTGEDASFVGKVTSKFQGITVTLEQHEISFIYGWGQDTYHASGHGPDKPGEGTATERVADWMTERLKTKYEPKGNVVLQPKLKYDYAMQARQFTGGMTAYNQKRRGKVGIIQLGSAGDIFNVLPVAKRIHDLWDKPLFFVSRVYAPLLDGVSYVEPHVIDLPPHCIKEAVREATAKCEYVIKTQQFGEGFNPPRYMRAYDLDEWQMAGMVHLFQDKENMPLVIDRRDGGRERLLINSVKNDKPLVLVHVTGGYTAPWKDGNKLMARMKEDWSEKVNLVDIAPMCADRIYDMLGLFDEAKCLISSDTYPIHLAAASKVPVIAIVNDGQFYGFQWLKSSLRCNVAARFHYSTGFSQWPQIYKVMEGLMK